MIFPCGIRKFLKSENIIRMQLYVLFLNCGSIFLFFLRFCTDSFFCWYYSLYLPFFLHFQWVDWYLYFIFLWLHYIFLCNLYFIHFYLSTFIFIVNSCRWRFYKKVKQSEKWILVYLRIFQPSNSEQEDGEVSDESNSGVRLF